MKTEASNFGSNFRIVICHAKYDKDLGNYASVGIATSCFAGKICHAASLKIFELLV